MPEIEDYTRLQIAEFLPDAMERALLSYNEILKSEETEKSTKFKAQHDACKVAVAHIQLLIKLAKLADLPEEAVKNMGEDKQEQLRCMIENASSEINAYVKREE